MLHGLWVVHEGGQRVGNCRVPGVTGLGGYTEIGEPQSPGDDPGLDHARRPNGMLLPCLQEDTDIKYTYYQKEKSENQRRPHRLFTMLHVGTAPKFFDQSRGDFCKTKHLFTVVIG